MENNGTEILRQPLFKTPYYQGPFDPNREGGYNEMNQVSLFGAVWQSKRDNNQTAPAVWDGGDIITPNTTDWFMVSGDYNAWLLNQPKPATTGTTGDHPYNGLGRIVLKKNMVNTGTEQDPVYVNTLTQDMFYKGETGSRVPNTNTIFVVQYDFVLGENVTIPSGCVLEFDGGSISNASGSSYTLTGTATQIKADKEAIFTNMFIAGTWNCHKITSAWFSDAQTVDNTLRQLENLISDSIYNEVTIEAGDYWIEHTQDRNQGLLINKPYTKVILIGNLRLRGTDYDDKRLFVINSTHDIVVTGGGYIYGDKLTHIYADGNTYPDGIIGYYQPDSDMSTYEKCHTFSVSNSYNILIDGINIRNSVGDGIDLIHGTPTTSYNIIVRNVTIENTRRQGITANAVCGILENISIKKVHGTSPEAGIDIEITTNPEHSDSEMVLRNIRVEDCSTGIQFYAAVGGADIKNILVENFEVKDTVRGFRVYNAINNIRIKDSIFECDLSRYPAQVGGARSNYNIYKNMLAGDNCTLENCQITFVNDIPAGEEITGEDVFALTTVNNGYESEADNRRYVKNCKIICPKINAINWQCHLKVENCIINALSLKSSTTPTTDNVFNSCTIEIAEDCSMYLSNMIDCRISLGGYILAHNSKIIGNTIFHSSKDNWNTDPNWGVTSYIFELSFDSFICDNKFDISKNVDAVVVVGQTSTATSRIPVVENNFFKYARFTNFIHTIPGMESSRIYAYNNHYYDVRMPDVMNKNEGASGTTRPTGKALYKGLQFFDETTGKPIWYNGTSWVDATGATV